MITILSLKSTKDPKVIQVTTNEGVDYVSLEIVLGQGLKSKATYDADSWLRIIDENQFHDYYQLAVAYIGLRPRSRLEIEQWGKKKELSGTLITRIIAKLTQEKLLDDEAFARWWIEQRTTFRPKGGYAMAVELQQKGVEKQLIDHLLHQSRDDTREALLGLAQKYLAKHSVASLDRRTQIHKLGAYLGRRGVDFGLVRGIIDELLK